jgi:8-oxo-dGTP pyrophosphatase MutT (NUDIX family)
VWVSPEEYYARLPKVIAGAGLILHDEQDRFLLVQPSYRDDYWEIPGGALDPDEDPWETARRESQEELGVNIQPGRLLVVDWMPAQTDGRPPLANFIFDGGTINQSYAEQHVHLPASELRTWQLVGADGWPDLLSEHMVRRLQGCADALATGSTLYLRDGLR